MMPDQMICLWCATPVTLRRGGSPRKFCCARCRHEFHSCARRWAEAAVAAGALSVDVLKNGDPAAYTLLPRATSVVTPQHLGPVAPFAGQQELERRMAEAVAMRRRG
jgi:hypothetical protein